jgi:hypothetical protein
MTKSIITRLAVGAAASAMLIATMAADANARKNHRAAEQKYVKAPYGRVWRGVVARGQPIIPPRHHGHVADYGQPLYWDYDACYPLGAYRPWHWGCY